ncbi:MAG: SIS domain-containing protein [Candidatus Humimicrobiaceae bacterium]
MDKKESFKVMKKVWEEEIEIISSLKDKIDIDTVLKITNLIKDCKKKNGKIITMGAGSSSIQARKIAHNFSCIEFPSFFLSTEVAMHGGLGVLQENDLLIALSRGGKTKEILEILPAIKKKKANLIAVTENEKSELAKAGDILLKIKIEKEADPLNMLATSSNAGILAVFDAIMVLMMYKENFKKDQFAVIHPGGAVGERLKEEK